ncbi:MAG: SPASM domain-containing protein [Candidatus Xenobiia bacterium LiM19]
MEPFRSLLNNIRKRGTVSLMRRFRRLRPQSSQYRSSGKASQCGRSSDWDILPYGSIKDRTHLEILHDEQRTILKSRNEILLQQECRDCRLWFLCHGGCPLELILGTRRLHTQNRVVHIKKTLHHRVFRTGDRLNGGST